MARAQSMRVGEGQGLWHLGPEKEAEAGLWGTVFTLQRSSGFNSEGKGFIARVRFSSCFTMF